MSLLARCSPRVVVVLAILGWVYWPTFRELYETWTRMLTAISGTATAPISNPIGA